MSASTASAVEGSLEDDLALLAAALRVNNSDTWAGKPQQQSFCVYDIAAASSAADAPRATPAEQSSSGSAGGSGDGDDGDDGGHALDALMADYITAVRNLRACEARTRDAAGDVAASAAAPRASAPTDMADLLHALDSLPPLPSKRGETL
ncbi:hypothetical protein NESM_000450700 [Novymonas esmeraldas]|uniref:Uncharacterized protein n=1 Tax=Novymonas esmeraldas TaxID=1808958 RepID=A0AAW0EPR8_9TRYP